MRNYYPGITLFKVLGCILVVFSHELFVPLMSTLDNRQPLFVGLAFSTVVPGFYLIAGFLACQGWTRSDNPGAYVRRYATRIAAVYGALCLLNTGRQIAGELLHGDTSAGGLLLLGRKIALRVFLDGAYQQLWFIPPLIFGIAASYALVSRRRERLWLGLAALALAASECLAGTLSGPVKAALPRLFALDGASVATEAIVNYGGFGFVFVGAGVLLAKREAMLRRLPVLPSLAFTVLLAAAETTYLMTFADWDGTYRLTFSTLPASVLMFYGITRLRWHAVKRHHRLLNRFSLVTFFGHTLWIKANLLAAGWTYVQTNVRQETLVSCVTLLECAAVVYAWMRVERLLSARRAPAGAEPADVVRAG